MRLVIIGTGGRLGAACARHFRGAGHGVVAFDRKGLDLARPEIIRDRLEPLAFDAVLVTAAQTNLDVCEKNPDAAFAANAHGPALVAELCAARGARLVHVSTDYVYDGSQPGLRTEDDATAPLGVYAASKLEGERLVLERTGGSALVARTSWVFGQDRPAFPDMMIARAMKDARVEAIGDKFSTPTYAADFAEMIAPFLEGPLRGQGGVLNVCNSGGTSWVAYGLKALDLAAAAGVALETRTVEPLRLADMTSFKAPRPVHTAMDTARLSALLGRPPRLWEDALAAYIGTFYGRAG